MKIFSRGLFVFWLLLIAEQIAEVFLQKDYWRLGYLIPVLLCIGYFCFSVFSKGKRAQDEGVVDNKRLLVQKGYHQIWLIPLVVSVLMFGYGEINSPVTCLVAVFMVFIGAVVAFMVRIRRTRASPDKRRGY